MNVESKGLEITHSFNIDAVKEMIAQKVKQISMEMVQALMSGLQEKLDFKGLAEKHISPTQKDEISASDEKIQRIYQKLFLATHEFIQKNSPPLVTTLAMIQDQTGSEESAGMFLGTFVLPAAKSLIEELKVQQPEALDNKEIWG